MMDIPSPLQAQIVQWLVPVGADVRAGDLLVLVEAMKMEHEVRAPAPGRLLVQYFAVGETAAEGDALGALQPATDGMPAPSPGARDSVPAAAIRPDLQRVLDRLAPLVWLCAGATMAAAYKSESYGVSVSVGLALTAGAWVASRIARRRHAGARFGLALAGGFVAVALWALFFATLWRAL